jgi:hypothetical protein
VDRGTRGRRAVAVVQKVTQAFRHQAKKSGKWMMAGAGTFVFLPREVPHGFRIQGDAPARLLLLCSPGGFERVLLANPFRSTSGYLDLAWSPIAAAVRTA